MPSINIGSPAPQFELRDARGNRHALSDYRGRIVVLYFYPEDDTPLCTAQACQFRDHQPDFSKIKCVVLGVSPDDQTSHADFAGKHGLPFTLLSDPADASGDPKVSTLYGAWGEKNMYGRVTRAMLRTTYLIGPDGKVVRRWDRVKTPGHAAAVLQAAKALHAGESLTTLSKPKPTKALSPKARKPAKKRTRTFGGREAYAGVRTGNGKASSEGSKAMKDRARGMRSRGKAR